MTGTPSGVASMDTRPSLGDLPAAEGREALHEVPFPLIENGA
jgi:hypothetical protein